MNLKSHLVSSPCHGQGHLPLSQVAPSPIQPGLEHFRDGAATASLGNLCQGLTTLTGKNFFLTSDPNLPSIRWMHSPFSYHSMPLSKIPLQLLEALEGALRPSPSSRVLPVKEHYIIIIYNCKIIIYNCIITVYNCTIRPYYHQIFSRKPVTQTKRSRWDKLCACSLP